MRASPKTNSLLLNSLLLVQLVSCNAPNEPQAQHPKFETAEEALAYADKMSTPIYAWDEVPQGAVGDMTVLGPGDSLEAHCEFGFVRIRALSDTRREITVQYHSGKPQTVEVEADKRGKAFRGMTGIYTGGRFRVTPEFYGFQEGLLFLPSMDDAKKWLETAPGYGYAVSDNGLIVGLRNPKYGAVPEVELVQLYVEQEIPQWRAPKGRVEIIRNRKSE